MTLYGEVGALEDGESSLRLGTDVLQSASEGFGANLYGETKTGEGEPDNRVMLEFGLDL